MALSFDKEGLAKEILNKLENELQWVLQAWQNEVIKYMGYAEFQKNADVDFEIKKQTNAIVAYLKANTYVLADSYGTGSLMLEDNPGFQAYKQSWHNARKTKAITGRPKGNYTDIFGNQRSSSGAFEGEDIEGWLMYGNKIEPVAPSRTLEIAEGWLYKTYLPRAYSNAIKSVNFAKFLKES